MWHENDNFKRCLRSLTTESGSQSAKIHCKSGTACRLCSPKTQLYHKHFQKTECQKKNQTAIVTNPIEECNLVPSKRCVHVAKMVPKLRVTTMCVDVPREVCTKSQIKPKKVKKNLPLRNGVIHQMLIMKSQMITSLQLQLYFQS